MTAEREPLMTVAQIALRLTVSQQTVRRLFERHELRGAKVGAQWRARPEDVERLATPAEMPTGSVSSASAEARKAEPSGVPTGQTFREAWQRVTQMTGAASTAARRSGSARTKRAALTGK